MTTPAGHRAAADLRAICEQWGDLLYAIERRPDPVWPPVDNIRQLLDTPTIDSRIPLTLREHPAPVNLDALDAALSIEDALFTACDHYSVIVQRHTPADDPHRWQMPTHRSATLVRGGGIAGAGSRAHGLHWAAVWLEDRAIEETYEGLYGVLRGAHLDDLAEVADHARRRLESALGRDNRPTVLSDPCPYCGALLTARTRSGDPHAAVIRCERGFSCTAPVVVERGRRTWRGADLATLYGALSARRTAAA